jgi:hypothetical protein
MRRSLTGAVLLLLCGSSPVRAEDALRPCLKKLGGQVHRVVNSDPKFRNAVRIGSFTPTDASANLSPAIQKILMEELREKGVRIDDKAGLTVTGKYHLDARRTPVVFHLSAALVDKNGKRVDEVSQSQPLPDRTTAAPVYGLTLADAGRGVSPEKEQELIVRGMREPSVHRDGTEKSLIRAQKDSAYAVEIRVKSGDEYRARAVALRDGKAYVPLRRDEVFAVNVVNDSPHDAAVGVTLDGLSMFAFNKSPKDRYDCLIVPRKSHLLVRGWFRSLKETDEFKLTEYSQSAAFKLLDRPGDVGTITVSFAAAWDPKTEAAPDDERADAKGIDDVAVGRGQTVQVPFTVVSRTRGRVRDVVTVRYRTERSP